MLDRRLDDGDADSLGDSTIFGDSTIIGDSTIFGDSSCMKLRSIFVYTRIFELGAEQATNKIKSIKVLKNKNLTIE